MRLSVVIPTRNKRPLLERTLGALVRQEPGTEEWEIVVVDDGSTDDTGAFLSVLMPTEPRLVVVSPPQNVGRAAARNLGWRQARGRWILFLDDDILVPPGLLAAHLEALAEPLAGTIGRAVTDPDIVDAPHFHYIDTRGVAKLPPGPAPGKYFVTQNAAVPREVLARIGGFDEDFSAYGFEDMDLGFRLEEAGVRFQVLRDPVPWHIHHHTLDEYLEKKRICGRASLRQLAGRHPERLAEMRLDLLLDPPGVQPSRRHALLRRLTAGPAGHLLLALLGHWSCRGTRPRFVGLYCRLMDAAVLTAYSQGLAEAAPESAT
jgi:glycosyltransferase involved in cell wall biosynthesis